MRRKRTRSRSRRSALTRTIKAALLIVVVIAIVGPMPYNEKAYQTLDDATHHWSKWGNQVIGLELTAPRQNVFSLLRDLSHTVKIVDHSNDYVPYTLGLANWLSRGVIYTVADALRWLDIPLTAQQARVIGLCQKLSELGGKPIVIQPDAWQSGIASWYGPGFHGRLAASGEIYDMYSKTAAHRTLPLGSLVRVVSRRTGQSTVVRINDRGPYVVGRIIDMSYGAKEKLGMDDLMSVYLERVDPAALESPCEQ